MNPIRVYPLPEHALLTKYAACRAYIDCYVTEVPLPVSHAEFVEAFYTTAVFKLERLLLAWFVSRPSTDAQAKLVATGELNSFAAWNVEARGVDQLLMCDFQGRTRSWLMVATVAGGRQGTTRLYFGSAVVPVLNRATGQAGLGMAYRVLLEFHKVYSRILLGAARSRLVRLAQVDQNPENKA